MPVTFRITPPVQRPVSLAVTPPMERPVGFVVSEALNSYQLAVARGYVGTIDQWIASLKGETGNTGTIAIVQTLTGEPGTNASLVEAEGSTANLRLYVCTIPRGDKGDQGDDADPAQVATTVGFASAVASVNGFAEAVAALLDDGASAYEIAVANGFQGTVGEWLVSLQGANGLPGEPGTPGADFGVAARSDYAGGYWIGGKASKGAEDFDTTWTIDYRSVATGALELTKHDVAWTDRLTYLPT